ncbi:MAG: cadherin-like beta sandwich domain-containing protein, partial [Sphingobacteriales bacterium]
MADTFNNTVKEIPAGGGTPVIIGSGFISPAGVAVDAAGNVYVADTGNGQVKKIPAGGGVPVTIGSGFIWPHNVAVDAAGNLYVSDSGNGAVTEILAGGGTQLTINSVNTLADCEAVDAAGNVYVGDVYNNTVKEIPAGGGTPLTIGTGFNGPAGLAVDAAGNVYVSNAASGTVTEIPAGGGTPLTIGSGFSNPEGIAIDAAGKVYVADAGNNAVKELIPAGGYYTGPFLPLGLTINTNTGVISGTPTVLSPATNYTVTAYNAAGSGSANLNIKIITATSNTDATLSNLTASSGAFDQAFASGTNHYTQTVPFTTSSITVTPTTNNPGATVKVNGTLVASGSASGPISLNAGSNTITVTGKAPNGITTDPYTITVKRLTAPLPTISYASPQTYTAGTAISPLTPTSSHVATQFYNTTPVTIASGLSTASVAVDAVGNIYVAGGNIVKEIPAGGGTQVTINTGFFGAMVVAVDPAGDVYVTAGNVVKKIPAGGGTPLTIGSGFNDPRGIAVDAAGNVYVTDYISGTVTKIPAGGGAPVTIGSGFIALEGVAVDAAGNVYVIDNTTAKKIPAGGGAPVTIGSGFAAPNFLAVDAAGNVYVADTDNQRIQEMPVGGGAQLTICIGFKFPVGVAIDAAGKVYIGDSGNNAVKEIIPVGGYYTGPFLPAGLTINTNTGVISGTPTAASPATNYTVTAYNAVGSGKANLNIKIVAITDASLSNLTASSGAFDQFFAPGITSYAQTVPYTTSGITVTPTTNNPKATVTVNGNAVTSGSASGPISLNVGPNTITVTGKAQDGVTTKTYTITVNRTAVSTIASLSHIVVNPGVIITQVGSTLNYTGIVDYATSSVTLTPTTTNPFATVTVNGTPVASGTASGSINLPPGSNIITLVSTAQDGVTVSTYTVTLTRSVFLSGLTPGVGSLSPVFAGSTTAYTETVGKLTAGISLTPATIDPTAIITVNGTTVASGTASASIPLAFGANTIPVVITSADHLASTTYTATITRSISANANLRRFTLNPAAATMTQIAPGSLNYTGTVSNRAASVTVTPVTADPA